MKMKDRRDTKSVKGKKICAFLYCTNKFFSKYSHMPNGKSIYSDDGICCKT